MAMQGARQFQRQLLQGRHARLLLVLLELESAMPVQYSPALVRLKACSAPYRHHTGDATRSEEEPGYDSADPSQHTCVRSQLMFTI